MPICSQVPYQSTRSFKDTKNYNPETLTKRVGLRSCPQLLNICPGLGNGRGLAPEAVQETTREVSLGAEHD